MVQLPLFLVYESFGEALSSEFALTIFEIEELTASTDFGMWILVVLDFGHRWLADHLLRTAVLPEDRKTNPVRCSRSNLIDFRSLFDRAVHFLAWFAHAETSAGSSITWNFSQASPLQRTSWCERQRPNSVHLARIGTLLSSVISPSSL